MSKYKNDFNQWQLVYREESKSIINMKKAEQDNYLEISIYYYLI